MERHQRRPPVDRLRDAGLLVEVLLAELLHERADLSGEPLVDARHLRPQNLVLPLEARVVDPEVEAAALERIVDFACAVGGDDHEGLPVRLQRAQLRDRDLEVGEHLQQERLELLVGAVDLVDEQHGRPVAVGGDRLQQRAADQIRLAEQLLVDRLDATACGLSQLDAQELFRVVPLIERVGGVQPLVTLKTNEVGLEHGGQHLAQLRLADTGLALQEERLAQLRSEEDGGSDRAVREITAAGHSALDRLDRAKHGGSMIAHGRRPGPPLAR